MTAENTLTTAGAVLSADALDDTAAPSGRGGRPAIRYLALVALAVVVLFPLYVTIVNSLLKPVQLAQGFHWYPPTPQWSNYSKAWTDGHLGRYLGNSMIVS